MSINPSSHKTLENLLVSNMAYIDHPTKIKLKSALRSMVVLEIHMDSNPLVSLMSIVLLENPMDTKP